MRNNIVSTVLRFNLSKPLHAKAWNYLSEMDKDKYKSYTNAVVIAVIDLFEREQRLKDDPYFETREMENAFIERIVEAVTEQIKHSLPTLSVLPLQDSADNIPQPETEKEIDEEYVDWDFLG